MSNVGGRLKIAKEFIDRLERVVHVKKVKNNVLASIFFNVLINVIRIVENIVTIMQGKKRV